MSLQWHSVDDLLPEFGVEVLVWVDGHRGPAWTNRYAVVAYLSASGLWWEERHDQEELIGVTHWAKFNTPASGAAE